jgi:tetratricopeptide (TPR) repeat protein
MNPFRSVRLVLPLLLVSAAFAGDLDEAKAYQKEGKLADALRKYELIAKTEPENPDVAIGMSEVLVGLGRFEEAEKAVDPARKANPANVAVLLAKARAFNAHRIKLGSQEDADGAMVDGLRADADQWLSQALKLEPKNPDALLLRAQIRRGDGDEEGLRKALEEAVAAAPASVEVNLAVADFWYAKGGADNANAEAWTNAAKFYQAAATADPASGKAAVGYAHCQAWLKAPAKDVAAAYLVAVGLLPGDDVPLSKLFQWVPAAERTVTFDKLCDAAPEEPLRKVYFAACLLTDKKYDKALEVLDEAQKLDPMNPRTSMVKGDVKFALNKIDDAILSWTVGLGNMRGKCDPDTFKRLGYTVAFETKAVSLEQKEQIWEALWKNSPDRYGLSNDVGLFFRDTKKDYKKSLVWYLRAAEVGRTDACVQNDTGVIYHYHMKDFEKAESYYRHALAIGREKKYDWNGTKPPDVGYRDAINNLGTMLLAQQRYADLKAFIDEFVPPEHPQRAFWLKAAGTKPPPKK